MRRQQSATGGYTIDVAPVDGVSEVVSSRYSAAVAAEVENNPRRWYEVQVRREDYEGGGPVLGAKDDAVLDRLSGMKMGDLRDVVGDAFEGPIGFNGYRPFQQEADDAWYERDAFFYCSGDLAADEIRGVFQEAIDELSDGL